MTQIKIKYNKFLNSLKRKKFLGVPLDNFLAKASMALVLIIVIVLMLPSERPFEYSNLTVGSVAREEIIAPFTFPVLKSGDQLEKERREAWLRVPPVFVQKSKPGEVQELKLKNLFSEITHFFQKLDEKSKSNQGNEDKLDTSAKIDSLSKQVFVKYNVNITLDELEKLFRLYESEKLDEFQNSLMQGFELVNKQGILNVPKDTFEEDEITIIDNGVEEEAEFSEIFSISEARNKVRNFISQKYSKDSPAHNLASVFVSAFLTPDLIYDKELTKTRKDKALREVPPTSGFVHQDQRIVDNHEIITEDIFMKLQSLAEAQRERGAVQQGWNNFLFYVGEYLLGILMVFLIGFYLFYYKPRVFADNKILLMITTVFAIQFFIAMLIDNVLQWHYLIIPVILGPMLLSMLLDASIAFYGTIIISMVLGAALGSNFYFTLMSFVVGVIALFSVQKIRNRGQMFQAILFIILGYAFVNFSYGFIHFESFKTMFQNLAFYQIPNAIMTPTAVFLLIGIFERFFDVTTDITLLELSDMNHPLLKRLSVEAPGTFHHSIIVGNLAESAAKAIGANSLLARVGCYYHDIGKMQRAEYFVENQADTSNKHEKLTPTMSSLILAKHVKAGLKLADDYGLPRAVKQFIPEHHGTNLMTYFYHKAMETREKKDVRESDFRYPGPKPQSKETAIVMLADSVEAATRTLANPNRQRISTFVEELIEKRFRENELDECDLTLRELNKIKDAFIPVLMGIHHIRVEYPKEDSEEEKAKQKTTAKQRESQLKNKQNKKQTTKVNAQFQSKNNADESKPVTALAGDKDNGKEKS